MKQCSIAFYEDFRSIIKETIPENRLTFDYTHPDYDKEGKYVVDCRINGMPKPIFLFGILNESKCKDAMITMYLFERWGVKYHQLRVGEKPSADFYIGDNYLWAEIFFNQPNAVEEWIEMVTGDEK